MAEREFIFRQEAKELILPVTPGSYRVGVGVNIEIVNIHELGDAILTGYGTLATIQIDCLLPANSYRFAQSSSPKRYITQFTQWVNDKARLRFIVGGAGVNIPVVIESFQYGEQDGANDIYATITAREYRVLAPVQIKKAAVNAARTEAPAGKGVSVQQYTAAYGDTLSGI